ncbi:hypothetical protein HYV80_00285 [Candidatus Woesearchaeota archaeon]|nr:hypothetical protein [Candidatus Woesearchaeota archaeon]
MLREFATPTNNEQEFLEISSKLEIKKIYFFYDFDRYLKENTEQKLIQIRNSSKIEIETGFIVNQGNMKKASARPNILIAKSSEKDRLFIESGKVKIIYGFEETSKKDFIHQRASGLNHIICELAKKNNAAIGFSYSALFKDALKSPALMGRMMQNIALCQKYKVKTVIGSFSEQPFDMRQHHDVMSLFTMLGMGGKAIRESLTDLR